MPELETPALSVVVPCFNEAGNVRELVHRLTDACHKAADDDYEIILVNDGSTDPTWAKISALAEKDHHLVAVNLSRNHGHQLALSAGLSLSRGDRVFILDADLQDPPELLAAMIDLMDKEGADVVYGQRTARKGETASKCLTASLFYRLLARLGEVPLPHDAGDFRLISRRAVDLLNRMPERSRYIRGMVSWIGLKQVPLAYERQARFAGTTHYPFPKMLRLAVDAVTGFSIAPLRLASYAGALMGVAGLVVLLYALYAWLMGETVQGWTSLMVVVLVLGSVQLISLGVFGEYLGRLYMEAKRRPLFIIDKIERAERSSPEV